MAAVRPGASFRSAGYRAIVMAGALFYLTACSGSQSMTTTASPTPLGSRPLSVAAISPGAGCPVSAMQQFANPPGDKLPGYGYGPGPVYLSGQIGWYSGVYALILVPPSVRGPVLVRGHQLDGSNGVPLQNQSGSGHLTITGPDGSWRWWGGQMVGAPGCYALQIDGSDFSEQIVFSIIPGPAPPA